jgi:hypothetical protein
MPTVTMEARKMERHEAEIEWILSGPITGEPEARGIRVRDGEGHECLITFHCEPGTDGPYVLRFDGRYVNVGDDLAEFLAVMDEVARTGASAPFPESDHDCPKDEFLADPITRAYGVGSEMVSLISCAVCDAREAE